MMDDKKGTYMGERAITDQLLSEGGNTPAIDPEILAKLQQMARAEKESNYIREMANIGADMAEGGTKSGRLSLDDSAKAKLQGMLASSQGVTGKDRLNIQKERERMAGYDKLNADRQAAMSERLDKSLIRKDESLDQSRTRMDRPSEVFAGKMSDLDTIKEHMEKIAKLKDKVNTGAVTNALTSFAGKWISGDIPSEERTKLKTMTTHTLANYIKSISGAAVSEQEAKRLQEGIPNMSDDDAVFVQKMEAFNTLLAAMREEKIKALESTGRDISKFQDGSTPSIKEMEEAGIKEDAPEQPAEASTSPGVATKGGYEVWSDDTYDYRRIVGSDSIQKKRK